jgi:hypothetical protein
MTHCVEFFRKWKKEPNFCGLGKSACNVVEQYLSFVNDLSSDHGINEDIVYRNVPISSVKPLLKFKKDSDIRKKASRSIAQVLNSKQGVTGKYVNQVIGIDVSRKKFIQTQKTPQSEIPTESLKTNKLKDKIRLITSALSSGQMDILIDVMKSNNLENEYEALSLIIKWASERIKQ